MTALTSALEITKLAHEMHVDESELAFLATTSPMTSATCAGSSRTRCSAVTSPG